jgi:hypothetical protein
MGWGVNISEDARHWIVLLQYNPSTGEKVTRALRKGKKETEGNDERVRKKKGDEGKIRRWKGRRGKEG